MDNFGAWNPIIGPFNVDVVSCYDSFLEAFYKLNLYTSCQMEVGGGGLGQDTHQKWRPDDVLIASTCNWVLQKPAAFDLKPSHYRQIQSVNF